MTKPPTSDAAGAVFRTWLRRAFTFGCFYEGERRAGVESPFYLEKAKDTEARFDAFIDEAVEAIASTPQPPPEAVSVGVPELSVSMCSSSQYAKGWNDCRAAMLAAAPAPKECHEQ